MDRLLFVLYLTQIKDRLISSAEDVSNKLERQIPITTPRLLHILR